MHDACRNGSRAKVTHSQGVGEKTLGRDPGSCLNIATLWSRLPIERWHGTCFPLWPLDH